MPIQVLVVDDQPAARRAVGRVVEATPGFELCGEAVSAEAALAAAERGAPDLALVEVRIRGMEGPEIARRLHAAQPSLVVVLLSVDPLNLPPLVASSGAADLVRKEDLRPRLLCRLWAVHGRSAVENHG